MNTKSPASLHLLRVLAAITIALHIAASIYLLGFYHKDLIDAGPASPPDMDNIFGNLFARVIGGVLLVWSFFCLVFLIGIFARGRVACIGLAILFGLEGVLFALPLMFHRVQHQDFGSGLCGLFLISLAGLSCYVAARLREIRAAPQGFPVEIIAQGKNHSDNRVEESP